MYDRVVATRTVGSAQLQSKACRCGASLIGQDRGSDDLPPRPTPSQGWRILRVDER